MKYSELPNPSEPADSQRRIDAVLRVYKHIEDTKELSEDDKAEFFIVFMLLNIEVYLLDLILLIKY